MNESFSYLPLVELFISVSVERNETVVHSLSDLDGKVVVGEYEFNVAEFFFWWDGLDFDFVLDEEIIESGVDIIIWVDPELVSEIFKNS